MSKERLDLCLSAGNLAWWEMDVKTGKVIFNENKVKMLGFSIEKFKDADYTAFTNLLHPDDYNKAMQAMKDHLDGKKELYEIEYRIKTKKGEYKWFYDRGAVVSYDKEKNPLTVKGVVFDITDKKHLEEKLKQKKKYLERLVDERTKELKISNEKLNEEILIRKNAEEYSNRTKQHLRDVIDSASELIIAFDMNNRISIWNKTAELITGYKQIEVLNRSVGKLDTFNDPDIIIEFIKNICSKKSPKIQDITLINKDNEKRIIRTSGSLISGLNKECVGALFVGKDITKDVELHKQLLDGNSYIIKDKKNQSSIDLLIDITINNYQGLIITRGSPTYIKRIIPDTKNVKTILLSSDIQKGYENITDLENLKKIITNFIKENKKTVILLDGVHYLLSKFSFDSFIDTLFSINDYVNQNNSIMFIRIDPSTVDNNQLAVFENELQNLPEQRVEDLIIEDYLYEKLKYIFEQNQINAIVSFKKIMNKFKISYVTAASRLDSLEKKGFIYTKKQGKLRAIFITDKGKSLLQKRKTA